MRPIKPGKEQQDKLEQHFREQLRNMEVAPPAAMWDQIDAGLNQERRTIRYDHWYYVLLVLLLPMTVSNLVINYDIKDYSKAFFKEKEREANYGPRYNFVGSYPSQLRHLDHMGLRTIVQPLDMNYVEDVPYYEPINLAAIAKFQLSPFVASNKQPEVLFTDNSMTNAELLASLPMYDHTRLSENGGLPLMGPNGVSFGSLPDRVIVATIEPSAIPTFEDEVEVPAIRHSRFPKFESNKKSPLSLPQIKGFYFGADLGANETELVLKKSAFYPLIGKDASLTMKWGLSYGVKAGYNFTRHFGMEVGCTINSAQAVNYVDNANGILPINGEIKLSYLHIPVVAKYKFTKVSKVTGQPVSINLIGGVMYSHLKEASMKINESKLNDVKNLFATNELGLIVGLEYDVFLTPNIFFNVGGKASISTDVKSLPLVTAGKANSYNILLGINAGINFQMPDKKRAMVTTVPLRP